jgi:hypothetical protein
VLLLNYQQLGFWDLEDFAALRLPNSGKASCKPILKLAKLLAAAPAEPLPLANSEPTRLPRRKDSNCGGWSRHVIGLFVLLFFIEDQKSNVAAGALWVACILHSRDNELRKPAVSLFWFVDRKIDFCIDMKERYEGTQMILLKAKSVSVSLEN